MLLNVFTFIHSIFGAISLCAGVVALSKIFAGHPFEHWSCVFLKTALAASGTGLLLHLREIHQPVHVEAMALVYVAGIAVLAWRRFHLTRAWGLVFALSLMGVLCLDILVPLQHLFDWLPVLGATASRTTNLLSFITNSAVALFFAVMGIYAVRRYQGKPGHGF